MKTILGLSALAYSPFIARTAFLVDGRIRFTLFDDGMISAIAYRIPTTSS